MNPAQVGTVLALVSPVLAVGVVCFILFASGYSPTCLWRNPWVPRVKPSRPRPSSAGCRRASIH
jgi:hypothetical protein